MSRTGQLITIGLLVIAALLAILGMASFAALTLVLAFGLSIFLPLLGPTAGFLGQGDTRRFLPGRFNFTNTGSTPLPAGVTGVAGSTEGVSVTQDQGVAQVGFGAETKIDLFGLAEVGQSFLAQGQDQDVIATFYVEYNYNYSLAPVAAATIDIDAYVDSIAAPTMYLPILDLTPLGPETKTDRSVNPSFDPASPQPPLDANTLAYEVKFTKRRDVQYSLAVRVLVSLDGIGRIEASATLKEIRLKRA